MSRFVDPGSLASRVQSEEAGELLQLCPGLTELDADLLSSRGCRTPQQVRDFLEPSESQLRAPTELRQLDAAVELVREAVAQGQRILIHGDYDADGICATVLLRQALEELGAEVGYHIPDRFEEGYGLSMKAVERCATEGFGLLVSVDCGSSSYAEIEAAKRLGVTLVVTDHHKVPDPAPEPDAFVNPNHPLDSSAFSGLCGTAVAYKLVQGLRGSSGAEPAHLLDLVALATVADVVPLVDENRAFVALGLSCMNRGLRPGLKALLKVAGRDGLPLDSETLAFALAPRLNASGRLEHARLGVELLSAPTEAVALPLAARLDVLNERRKEHEADVREAIEMRFEERPERADQAAIVEWGPGWHEGVIGITAGRLADRYQKPTLVISVDGEKAKGSGRSPDNVDLYRVLLACEPHLLKFGGHPRAAGFSLSTDQLEEFRRAVLASVAELREGVAPVWNDGSLDLASLDLSLVDALERLEPFGEANPRPTFLLEGVTIASHRAVGRSGDHLQFELEQAGVRKRAIGFSLGPLGSELAPQSYRYDLLVQLGREQFRGEVRLRIQVVGVVRPRRLSLQPERGSVVDLRAARERRAWLEKCLDHWPDSAVLCRDRSKAEEHFPGARGRFYDYLQPPQSTQQALILLAPPPDLELLQRLLLQVRPSSLVLLFGTAELVQWERTAGERCWDRPTAEAIWRCLRGVAGRETFELEAVAPTLSTRVGRPQATVQEVLEAFVETGVLRSLGGDRYAYQNGATVSLEETRAFQLSGRRRAQLREVSRFFSGLEALERLEGLGCTLVHQV